MKIGESEWEHLFNWILHIFIIFNSETKFIKPIGFSFSSSTKKKKERKKERKHSSREAQFFSCLELGTGQREFFPRTSHASWIRTGGRLRSWLSVRLQRESALYFCHFLLFVFFNGENERWWHTFSNRLASRPRDRTTVRSPERVSHTHSTIFFCSLSLSLSFSLSLCAGSFEFVSLRFITFLRENLCPREW